jgi:hypothetical protein
VNPEVFVEAIIILECGQGDTSAEAALIVTWSEQLAIRHYIDQTPETYLWGFHQKLAQRLQVNKSEMPLRPCLQPREIGRAIWLISLVSSETAEDHDIYIGVGGHPRDFPGRWYPGYGDSLWGVGLKLCGELALRGAFGATRASSSVNFRKSGDCTVGG